MKGLEAVTEEQPEGLGRNLWGELEDWTSLQSQEDALGDCHHVGMSQLSVWPLRARGDLPTVPRLPAQPHREWGTHSTPRAPAGHRAGLRLCCSQHRPRPRALPAQRGPQLRPSSRTG